MRARPKISGCSIHSVPGAGARQFPHKPFAYFGYDTSSTSTVGPTPFMSAIREVSVRRIIIHGSTATIADTSIDLEDEDNNVVYALPLLAADITPGRVIEFPGEGLRFPHAIGLNKNSDAFYCSVVYDIIN